MARNEGKSVKPSFETFMNEINDAWDIYKRNMGKGFFPEREYSEYLEHKLYAEIVLARPFKERNLPNEDLVAERNAVIAAKREMQDKIAAELLETVAKLQDALTLVRMYQKVELSSVAQEGIGYATQETIEIALNRIVNARILCDDPSDLPL